MIQQQIEFLRGFIIRLEQRGFDINKCEDQITATKCFNVFNGAPAICSFTWRYPENVQVDVKIGGFWCENRVLPCLLMDYSGGIDNIITTVIRNTMRNVADEITKQMFPK